MDDCFLLFYFRNICLICNHLCDEPKTFVWRTKWYIEKLSTPEIQLKVTICPPNDLTTCVTNSPPPIQSPSSIVGSSHQQQKNVKSLHPGTADDAVYSIYTYFMLIDSLTLISLFLYAAHMDADTRDLRLSARWLSSLGGGADSVAAYFQKAADYETARARQTRLRAVALLVVVIGCRRAELLDGVESHFAAASFVWPSAYTQSNTQTHGKYNTKK